MVAPHRRHRVTPGGAIRGVRGDVVAVAAAALVAGYAWWVAGMTPFTGRMLVAVEAAGVAALALGWWRRRTQAGDRGAPTVVVPAGVVVWLVLVVALAGWELASYLQHPRDEHPTISHLFNLALETRSARAAAFAGWLVAAYALGRR